MAQSTRRVEFSFHTPPPNVQQSKAYIQHRVMIAGRSQNLFQNDVHDLSFQYAGGTPQPIKPL